jgi:hypothetical protein
MFSPVSRFQGGTTKEEEMTSKVLKVAFLAIMVLNGIFFAVNIYVLGDSRAAIAMHDDLAPTASALMANTKVLVTFFTGMLYLVAAASILRHRRTLLLSGVVAFILFDGLYVIELVQWGSFHSWVWTGFFIFGTLSFLIGVYSYLSWRRSEAV